MKFFNLLFKKTINNMQNIKITSDINRFKIGVTNWEAVSGQFVNPRVNWFYLLDTVNERIRCFDEQEAVLVSNFLSSTIYGQFGNNINCFINIQNSDCVNDECEYEVAHNIKRNLQNHQLPHKIFPRDFGVNSISNYTLEFNIIGYFY